MPRFDSLSPRAAVALRMGLPVILLATLFLALGPPPHAAPMPRYPDLPMPAHTGGFGEPTCQACHFDGALNEPGGRLRIEGWPEDPAPDSAYTLTVRLERDEMERAGFQLAIRTASGEPAGTLLPADGRSAVTQTSNGVQYLHHTSEGTDLAAPGEAMWRFTWRAPAEPAPLVLHVVANAANGDDSAFGDAIYADSLWGQMRR